MKNALPSNNFRKIKVCLIIIILITVCSCSSKGRYEIGINEKIHHDDFEYSVIGYDIAKNLGESREARIDSQVYYLVYFRVENNAQRVNHRWSNSIAYITDEKGNKYENDTTYQKILNSYLHFGWKEQYITPFQKTDTTVLVFTVPIGIKHPYLRVRGSILMGDVPDRARFLKTKIMLY
jgi:hypothetical protein